MLVFWRDENWMLNLHLYFLEYNVFNYVYSFWRQLWKINRDSRQSVFV